MNVALVDAAAPDQLPDYGAPYRYVVFEPGPARDTYLQRTVALGEAWRAGHITVTEYAWACSLEVDVYCATVPGYATSTEFRGEQG